MVLIGGDGGTRTRVRKNRPTNIYEHSWSLLSLRAERTSRTAPCQPLGPESPLSCSTWRFCTALRLCNARSTSGRSTGWADVVSQGGDYASLCLRRRGALRRRKCDWHLFFVLSLRGRHTLGSQFGTSLSRRSLASPKSLI